MEVNSFQLSTVVTNGSLRCWQGFRFAKTNFYLAKKQSNLFQNLSMMEAVISL